MEIHHGGKFTEFPDTRYEGGLVNHIDKVNSDLFSVIILNDMLVSLGYSDEDIVTYHFKVPNEADLDLGLRPLGNDTDVLNLIRHVEKSKVVEVYVEHLETHHKKDVTDDLGDVTQEPTVVDLNEGSDNEGSENEGSENKGSESDEGSQNDSEEEKDPSYIIEEYEDFDYLVDEDNLVEEVNVDDLNEFRAIVEHESFEYEEVHHDEENPENEVDDEEFENDSVPEDVTQLEQVLKDVRKKQKKSQQSLDSPFYLGQDFWDRDTISDLVKAHAVHSRRQLYISRNDLARFRVVCIGGNLELGSCEKLSGDGNQQSKGNIGKKDKVNEGTSVKPKPKKTIPKPLCPWTLHITRKKQKGAWVVKTYKKEHTCLHTRVVNLCTVSWLAKQIEQQIRTNPTIQLKSLQEELQRKYQIQITINQVFRAKAMATQKIQGDYEAQYKMLRDYAEELLRADPETTVKIDVEPCHNPSIPTRQFRRVYICLGALKRGFKAGMRELLGLDGCFLKGQCSGQILTAVGADGNSGIYPVVYALVEAETYATWNWFLELLGADLDVNQNNNFTFISDRQKVTNIPALTVLKCYIFFKCFYYNLFNGLCCLRD